MKKVEVSLPECLVIDDENIMKLVIQGTTRGRPINPQVPTKKLLCTVARLTKVAKSVSISQIAHHLPEFSYYDVHKNIFRLVKEKRLQRLNRSKPGESARISLPRKKAPRRR